MICKLDLAVGELQEKEEEEGGCVVEVDEYERHSS